jgi:hypothetical protein
MIRRAPGSTRASIEKRTSVLMDCQIKSGNERPSNPNCVTKS